MSSQLLPRASAICRALPLRVAFVLLFLALPACQGAQPGLIGLPQTGPGAEGQPPDASTLSAPPGSQAASPVATEDYQPRGNRQDSVLIDEAFDSQARLDELFSSGAAAVGFRSDWGSLAQRQSSQVAPPDNNMGGRPYRPVIGPDSKGEQALKLTVSPLKDSEKTPETVSLIANSNGVLMHSTALTFPLTSSYRKMRFLYDIKEPRTTGISNLWGSVWLVPSPTSLKAQHVTEDETNRILYREKIEFDLSEFLADFRHEGATVLMVVAHDHTKSKNPSWITAMDEFKDKLYNITPKGLPAEIGSYAPGDWIHVEADLDYPTNRLSIFYDGKLVLDTLADNQSPPRLQASTIDGNLVNIDFNLVISLVPGSSAYGWPGTPVVDPQVPDPQGEMFVKDLRVVATP